MDEFLIKCITATVAVIGAFLGFLHFLATRRSVGYQNLKTEIELLSQNVTAHEAEADYKKFLIDVRKEKISFLVFGIPIPNADVERVVTYYRNAEGKVTTGEIAKAWQYRDPNAEQLSFQLRGSFKAQYILLLIFAMFCMLAALVGALSLLFKTPAKEVGILICVSLGVCFQTLWMNQGLLTAARLGKLEVKRSIINDATNNKPVATLAATGSGIGSALVKSPLS